MRRPLILFLLFVAACLAAIGCGWFQQAITAGELAGHAAKIGAILHLLRTGDYAWFPDYLGGSPSASLLSFALAIPVYAPGILLAPSPGIGMKITALLLLALGGLAAYAFGRRASASPWGGFAVGVAWMLSPQLLLRAGHFEHMTILVAIPLVPLAFLALLRVAERGTPFDAILLAITWSATMLAWSKMGATLVIPLAIFAAWLLVSRPECRCNLLRGAVWAVPAALLLGVVPLLPLLRERGFMTVFELDQFSVWQSAYSARTATSWFDRGGAISDWMMPVFQIDRGGYYLGVIGMAAVAAVIFLTRRNEHQPREVALIRILLAIALAMFWISFGPRSVIAGHFGYLAKAENLPNLVIPLHWLALAAQGAFIFWCVPRCRARVYVFVAIFLIYLFVPAFRILEHLPVYADLRAPDSFWILNGSFAWAAASALAVIHVLGRVRSPQLRTLLAATTFLVACLDFAVYFSVFYRGGLDAKTLADFQSAADGMHLPPNRVLPVSGRYFYLEIPGRTGRPLVSEALNHYLLSRDAARLEAASRISATNMLSYLRIAGIGSVLVDMKDRDTPEKYRQWFRGILPEQYSNDTFEVLSNPGALYPAFFAQSAAVAPGGYDEAPEALERAKQNQITIASPSGAPLSQLPGLNAAAAPEFLRVNAMAPRTASRIAFAAPGKPGWIVLSESWHPDWTATVDGNPSPVYRAAGGFPAVPVLATDKVIEFHFRTPGWYFTCLGSAALAWCAALLFLAVARWLPSRFITPPPPLEFRAAPADELSRNPISRPLAIVPTRNEADNITALLDQILAADERLQAVVVDDASPDGTADCVRAHPSHGNRVHLIERPGKLGLASAYRDGFRWAMERGFDACIEIDADFSHNPADIPRLLAMLDAGADASIGSRYLDGLRVVNWPRRRLWLSSGASRFVRALTGLPISDTTSGFKALRTDALRALDWNHLRADGYGFQIELHWLLWKAGFRLVEVPIVFTERRAGQTKMTTAIAVEAAWRVLELAVADSRPSKEA